MDLSNLDIEKCEISPEEEARLNTVSDRACESCEGPMTIGCEEAFGVCLNCVSAAYDNAFSE